MWIWFHQRIQKKYQIFNSYCQKKIALILLIVRQQTSSQPKQSTLIERPQFHYLSFESHTKTLVTYNPFHPDWDHPNCYLHNPCFRSVDRELQEGWSGNLLVGKIPHLNDAESQGSDVISPTANNWWWDFPHTTQLRETTPTIKFSFSFPGRNSS